MSKNILSFDYIKFFKVHITSIFIKNKIRMVWLC